MEKQRIFIELSDGIRELLSSMDVDLVPEVNERLKASDIRVERDYDPSPGHTGPASRDMAVILLAAGGAAWMVADAVAQLIESKGRNRTPVVVTERSWVPALDGQGKPMLDQAGRPLMKWEETARLLQSTATPAVETSAKVEVLKLFSFELKKGTAGKSSPELPEAKS